MRDAQVQQSADGRFAAAYDAARFLCTVVLRAAGYRVASTERHHEITFLALPHVMGQSQLPRAGAYDAYRSRRHTIEYQAIPAATEKEVREFLADLQSFRRQVAEWLRKGHAELMT